MKDIGVKFIAPLLALVMTTLGIGFLRSLLKGESALRKGVMIGTFLCFLAWACAMTYYISKNQ
jgi:hypothetical protein